MKVSLWALFLFLFTLPMGLRCEGAPNPVVRVTTSVGTIDIQLFADQAPLTVANFLHYLGKPSNGYNGTFISRSAPGFVIQGGGFITSTFTDDGQTLHATHITTDPPVTNEFHLSNVRGTLAMAKMEGDPNSATSDWFVNLADNAANLDTANGGFTVFGSVIRGMSVVDAIAALPRIRSTGEGTPVRNYTPGVNATTANLINVTMVRLLPKTDFSGDFRPDIIWQNNTTGQRLIWLMNGTTHTSSVNLPTISAQWDIAGTGDFNGDGKTDILLQNSVTGQCTIWLMNGTVHTGGVALPTISTQWSIAGTGDFNGDGKTDILLQNSVTGQRTIWLMNGTVHTGGVVLPTISTQWSIAGAGDFNGDGKTDILLQNSVTGQRSVWLMNGTVRTNGVNLATISTQWDIRNH